MSRPVTNAPTGPTPATAAREASTAESAATEPAVKTAAFPVQQRARLYGTVGLSHRFSRT
jgi:hypothetical protein